MCTENMFAAGKKTGRNDGWRYLLYFYWVYTIIICTYHTTRNIGRRRKKEDIEKKIEVAILYSDIAITFHFFFNGKKLP